MESPVPYFKKEDALDVTWYPRANRKIQYNEATSGDYMMVTSDVVLGEHTPSGKKNIPIIAALPSNKSDLPLEEWLDGMLDKQKGIKLNMGTIEVIEPALKLRGKSDSIDQHVWINGVILKGSPGGTQLVLDNMAIRNNKDAMENLLGEVDKFTVNDKLEDLIKRLESDRNREKTKQDELNKKLSAASAQQGMRREQLQKLETEQQQLKRALERHAGVRTSTTG